MTFFETVIRKIPLFGQREEKRVWEKWTIPIVASPPGDPQPGGPGISGPQGQGKLGLDEALREAVLYIVTSVNSNWVHVPTAANGGPVFPFDVEIDVPRKEGWGIADFLRSLG
jgi:hypothetical protein